MIMVKKTFLIIGIMLLGIIIYYTIVVVEARVKTPKIVEQALKAESIKLEVTDLTEQQIDALLQIQDPNFYHHKGYDFDTPGAGVTSLSQALVKLYYFEDFKPGLKKIKQTLIARFAFDPLTPKDTILKLFINDVYLGGHDGQGIHGFENGANFYFSKPFKELDWDEYLSLIAMIRAPLTFHYFHNKKANIERVQRIKRLLSGEYVPVDNSDWLYDKR